MDKIKNYLLFMFILFLPIQDFFLKGTPLGIFGASPSIFFLLIVVMIDIILIVKNKGGVHLYVLLVPGYIVFLSLVACFFWGFESHGIVFYEKIIRTLILIVCFLYPIFFINYKSIYSLRRAFFLSYWLCVLGFLLGDVFSISIFRDTGLFHSTEANGARPRGLSSESSMFGAQVMLLGLLAAFFSRTRRWTIIYLLVTFFIVLLSGSKGGFVSLLLAIFIYYAIKQGVFKNVFGLVASSVVGVACLYILVPLIAPVFLQDIDEFTSFATRSVMAITSIYIVIDNPFGLGLFAYYPAVDVYVPKAMSAVSDWFGYPLNFSEVYGYVGGGDNNVSSKTFFFQFLAYFGLPFIFMLRQFYKQIIQCDSDILLVGLFFLMVALFFYIPGIGFYTVSVYLGVLWREKNSNSNI